MNPDNEIQQSIFIEQWQTYQNVIHHNYMSHAEIINTVSGEIEKFDSLAILDLGCGDAYVISQSIDRANAKNKKIDYRGIDLSALALDIAEANLKSLNGKIELINKDLLSELQSNNQRYNIILLGYSLHHLPTEEKQACFARIAQLLSTDGVFIFYDLEQGADENKQSYIDRACATFNLHWDKLNKKEISSICTHVVDNDIPENEQFYKDNFRQAGFTQLDKAFIDQYNLFAIYIARKSQ